MIAMVLELTYLPDNDPALIRAEYQDLTEQSNGPDPFLERHRHLVRALCSCIYMDCRFLMLGRKDVGVAHSQAIRRGRSLLEGVGGRMAGVKYMLVYAHILCNGGVVGDGRAIHSRKVSFGKHLVVVGGGSAWLAVGGTR